MNRVSTRRKKVREPGGDSPKENKVFTWFRTGVRDDGGLGHILIGTNKTEKDMSSPFRERSGESGVNE